MNLQGSITELQDKIVKLYLQIEHRFNENQLIRDLWTAMAHDVTQQKQSMSMIPPSFWTRLKSEQSGLAAAISEGTKQQLPEKQEDQSLRSCFESALTIEEPAILKVYVPIIRKLRENWTDQALDFYIMVKAHLARIERVTRSFAGDPALIQRSTVLLQRFEKEVQEPQFVPEIKAGQHAPEKQDTKPHKKQVVKQAPALAKHAQSHHKRSKPIVEKINLSRRRARR